MNRAAGTDGIEERIRAGVAVLSASSVVSSVSVAVRGGAIVGWETVPEGSLSDEERATILTPGLINAHTHLDLGALKGAVPGSGGFLAWVGELVAAREGLFPEEIATGVRASAWEALRTGTTTLLDIDSMGSTAAALSSTPSSLSEEVQGALPRILLLREILDGSPQGRSARSEAAYELARQAVRAGHGLSPHATHTVGDALLADLGALLAEGQQPRVPLAVHWAETPEETQWLLHGEGPFAAWLGPSSGQLGTERLALAGLLRGATLIHGNDPQPGEPERLAAADATLVHCPGCHRFFGRPRFPVERYQRAGVRLALGTDSWASNDALDMRREMHLARETLGLDAPTVWRMATEHGASTIPDAMVTGTIAEGSSADLVAFRRPRSLDGLELGAVAASALETLTSSAVEIRKVWVGGADLNVDSAVR